MTMLVMVDDGGGDFGPLTHLRPVFELVSGAHSARQRAQRAVGLPCAAWIVPPDLADVARDRTEVAINALPANHAGHDVLFINGRLLDGRLMQEAKSLPLQHALVQQDGQRVAARVSADRAPRWWSDDARQALRDLHVTTLPRRVLAQRPWHLLADLENNLRFDLDTFEQHPRFELAGGSVTPVGSHAIRVAANAKLHPMVVLNAEKGPIVIDHAAVIGSFAVVAGPCYIGPNSIVAPHTHVRSGTSVGPHCVVGGEISAAILAGYTNKAHAGYLGNSYVGQWVNLGADTNVSNLKNTYGSVRMQLRPGGDSEDSGLLKLGPVIGDFVRTAIGSRLLTGSCIGTMLAVSGFAPKCAASFRFITDDGDERYDIDKLIATIQAMTSRRGMNLSAAQADRLRRLATAS
jgi:UDP-N-acetylglucosamine diphosphorylase/glucosamine-1-phosphate N-acetyltransferase